MLNQPIDELTEIKMDVVIRAVTEYIYCTCHFVAHEDHMDSATCSIFGKVMQDQNKDLNK